MSNSFEFGDVERVTIGTIGEPGGRTFYLQVRQAGELVSLKLEKQQAAALAQLLAELLSDLPTAEAPPDAPGQLEEPVHEEWPVGTMQLAYDTGSDRVVLLAEEVQTEEQGGDGTARLSITRAQAAALVVQATHSVGAGRPTCPLCGNPMDPSGHSCPRTNGHGPAH